MQIILPLLPCAPGLVPALLTRRLGPAGAASPLLEHLARLGRAELARPPRTH